MMQSFQTFQIQFKIIWQIEKICSFKQCDQIVLFRQFGNFLRQFGYFSKPIVILWKDEVAQINGNIFGVFYA